MLRSLVGSEMCIRDRSKLRSLQNVGMGYVQLGQSSSTLSGGEAQRIKLATFLLKGNKAKKTLFIFDEPTTGLHFHDIKKLLNSFNSLIDNGHSIIVVEHNLDLIKCSDKIIDLGAKSITAYTTHGVLTGKALEKIENSKLTELVITDSINNDKKCQLSKKIRVISVSDLLGEAIKRISEESSVSSLFDF